MSQSPCGWCGRAKEGEPYVRGRDCRTCWLGLNRASHAAWHPDPAKRLAAPLAKCGSRTALVGGPAFTVTTALSGTAAPTRRRVRAEPESELVPLATAGPSGKPGTELSRLIRDLGFPLCQAKCRKMAAWMDGLGPWGCWANRDTILKQLRDTASKLKWHQRLKAAGLAVWSGLAFKLDPSDPAPGLLTEAIRRALRHGDDEPILLTLAEGNHAVG